MPTGWPKHVCSLPTHSSVLPRSAQQRPCRLLARLYSNAGPLCLPAFTLCLTWLPFRSIRLTGLVCFELFFTRLQMRAHSGAFPLWTIGLLPTRALEQGLKIIWVWSVARLGVVSALFPRVPDVFLVFRATYYLINSIRSFGTVSSPLDVFPSILIWRSMYLPRVILAPVFPIQGHQRHAHFGGIIATGRPLSLLPTRALEQGLKIIWVWSVARLSVRSISPMPFVYGVPPSCDTFSGGMLWILYTFFRKESQLLLYSTSFAKILHRTASLSLFLETTSSVVKRGLSLERPFIGQDVTRRVAGRVGRSLSTDDGLLDGRNMSALCPLIPPCCRARRSSGLTGC